MGVVGEGYGGCGCGCGWGAGVGAGVGVGGVRVCGGCGWVSCRRTGHTAAPHSHPAWRKAASGSRLGSSASTCGSLRLRAANERVREGKAQKLGKTSDHLKSHFFPFGETLATTRPGFCLAPVLKLHLANPRITGLKARESKAPTLQSGPPHAPKPQKCYLNIKFASCLPR